MNKTKKQNNMIIFILIILILPYISSCQKKNISQNEDSKILTNSLPLYKVVKNGKWGFINQNGEIVISLQFDYINKDGFCEGLASVKYKGKFGIIDETGKWIIQPIYQNIFSFSEGKAGAMFSGKWGFIDKYGNKVSDFVYKRVCWFHENQACVVREINKKNMIAFINEKGKIIIPFIYEEEHRRYWDERPGYRFQNGIIPVRFTIENKFKFGYIDKKGIIVVKPQFDSIELHQYGYAAVMVENNGKEKWGYIDAKGNYIVKPIYDRVYDFYKDGNNLYGKVKLNGKTGYINQNGEVVIQLNYSSIHEFYKGIAVAQQNKGDLLGIINTKEEWVVEPKFDYYVGDFSEDLADCIVSINGQTKYGYADQTGKIVIEPKFDKVYPFDANGIAMVEIGENENTRFGYINRNGEYIWEPSK